MSDVKTCGTCGEVKPLTEFNKMGSGNRRKACRKCTQSAREERRKLLRESNPNNEGFKVCSDCDQEKPMVEFVMSVDRKDGRGNFCKLCNQDRARSKRFNIPIGWYDVMLTKQDGKCGIEFCSRRVEDTPKGILYVDHDRACCPGDNSCGKCVRGLICSYCNSALGYVNDNVGHLIALIGYLQSNLSNETNRKEV